MMETSQARRVMFYVQHLLGIGHLRRAALLSSGLVEQGLEVSVILGGTEVPGIDFPGARVIHLPSTHVADHTFSPLLDARNKPVDDDWKADRAARLLRIFHEIQPHVILLEMFPFGRRQFRFELMDLLDTAKMADPKPVIISSVRDILVKKSKPERDREVVSLVRDYFDLVLVHGDPGLVTLEDTFPQAHHISDLTRYTGYIAPPQDDDQGSQGNTAGRGNALGRGEIIVSAGGGAVGADLFRTALEARQQGRFKALTWRLITGPNLPQVDFEDVCSRAPEGVIVERFRADLPRMMGHCAVSISQAGYNTVMDLIRARAKAIVVPYDDGGESEQLQRARLFAAKGTLSIVEAQSLNATSLNAALDHMMSNDHHPGEIPDLSGAQTSARIIADSISSFEQSPARGTP